MELQLKNLYNFVVVVAIVNTGMNVKHCFLEEGFERKNALALYIYI